MHIALVNRWYPPHTGYGGVAVYNQYLAHALVKLEHRVTVVAARWSASIPAMDKDQGLRVHRILVDYPHWPQRLPIAGRYVRALRQLRYSILVARKLRELEAADSPDLIEFADVEAEGFAYLLRRMRRPVLVRCHTPGFVLRQYYSLEETPYDTSVTTAMEKYCIRHADALTAPSHDMARTIANACRIAKSRFSVIPNALDVNLFSKEASNYDGKSIERGMDGVTVLHVGRLERVKGIETLIHAIPQVIRQNANTTFVFIGDDRPDGAGSTWRCRLEAYARDQSIENAVRILGPLSQDALIEWYRKSDIVVVPSMLYESFSYTCAQAMAAGLPVIASQIGGIPETLGDCGVLVPVADSRSLAAALCELIQRPELRQDLGRNALCRAQQYFDSSIVAQQTVAAYRQILAI